MLQKCSLWRVAQVFFDEPIKEHYLMEISRKSNLSHTSVKNKLKTLIDEGIISKDKEKRGKRIYPIYKAKLESKKYKKYKKIDILHRIEEVGLNNYLKGKYQPDCIVLFGSAARGEDTEKSDLDLFLQMEKEEINLNEFEEKLNRKIQLHISRDIKNYPEELKNNIANGILLHGYLDIF
ncbi:MAG: nucleotidyltransferase family protein [archaeon]